MAAEGGSKVAGAGPGGRTAVENALADRLAVIWRDPTLRGHPFFERWFNELDVGPREPERLLAFCAGHPDPDEALVVLRSVVRSLNWQQAAVLERSRSVVTEAAELATLVLCQRLIRMASESAGQVSPEDGTLRLPIGPRFFATVLAAAWLDVRVTVGHHGPDQKLFVRNLMSDLPPTSFGWFDSRAAMSAELNAHLNYVEGRCEQTYFQRRQSEIEKVRKFGVAREETLRAQLAQLKRKHEPLPFFGFDSQQNLPVDAADVHGMRETYGVPVFLHGVQSESTQLQTELDRLAGTILQSLQVIMDQLQGVEREMKDNTIAKGRAGIFISYSHKDKDEWLPRFQDKLAPLQRHASIDVWDDTKIRPGDDWADEIDRALQSCKVALLLISDGFLASKFIAEKEFPDLLTRHREGGMRVYPILLKDCMWELDPELARLQIKMAAGTQPLEACAADSAKLNAEMTRIAREVLAIIQGK